MVTLQTSSLWLEAPNKRTGDTQKNLSDFQAQTQVLSCALLLSNTTALYGAELLWVNSKAAVFPSSQGLKTHCTTLVKHVLLSEFAAFRQEGIPFSCIPPPVPPLGSDYSAPSCCTHTAQLLTEALHKPHLLHPIEKSREICRSLTEETVGNSCDNSL